jgi:hypothetical protein
MSEKIDEIFGSEARHSVIGQVGWVKFLETDREGPINGDDGVSKNLTPEAVVFLVTRERGPEKTTEVYYQFSLSGGKAQNARALGLGPGDLVMVDLKNPSSKSYLSTAFKPPRLIGYLDGKAEELVVLEKKSTNPRLKEPKEEPKVDRPPTARPNKALETDLNPEKRPPKKSAFPQEEKKI